MDKKINRKVFFVGLIPISLQFVLSSYFIFTCKMNIFPSCITTVIFNPALLFIDNLLNEYYYARLPDSRFLWFIIQLITTGLLLLICHLAAKFWRKFWVKIFAILFVGLVTFYYVSLLTVIIAKTAL